MGSELVFRSRPALFNFSTKCWIKAIVTSSLFNVQRKWNIQQKINSLFINDHPPNFSVSFDLLFVFAFHKKTSYFSFPATNIWPSELWLQLEMVFVGETFIGNYYTTIPGQVQTEFPHDQPIIWWGHAQIYEEEKM